MAQPSGPERKRGVFDETQERLIHRLEAFSDVVIGFSLAQLALSMGIPKHGAADFFRSSYGTTPLIAFVITFSLVCGIWWAHHRLFTHYFVPNAGMMLLNFVTLACVGLAVYGVQLMVRPHSTAADFTFYESVMAAVYGLIGVQYFYGWCVRRADLEPKIAELGLRTSLMLAGVTLIFGVTAVLDSRSGLHVASLRYVGFVILGYSLAVRLIFLLRAKQAHGGDRLTPSPNKP